MPKVKHIGLRKEDESLLLHLHDFIYLDKDFIEKYIYTQYTNPLSAYRRLKVLVDAGYIKVFLRQVDNKDHRPSNVYTLSKFGAATVEQLVGVCHWKDSWSNDTQIWWRHSLMIAHCIKSFQIQAETVGLKVYQYIPEARAEFEFPLTGGTKTKTSIKPDGIMVLGPENNSESRVAVFIEMERSYSTRERTIRKIDQFNHFFGRREELLDNYQRKVAFEDKISSWVLLFIGATESKTNKLVRDLSEETAALPVLVASREDVLSNPFGKIYRDTRIPEQYTTL